ncbi:uncharacterized protein LOC105425151 [Pogonomyrmex barbatus]|uniref:Uncharacterized protein LOC105425151 n=1 Tax=Pogonomyrmex barbatus TaxID=144034 RepID=A0A6I9W2G6_9HYME|nr:uncharacterized protein LOC105425151 [Pogonomyrmex barbatus]
MICLQVHYNLNRILLLAVGLWPYQQSKFTQFQCIFIFSTLSACIVFQLTPLISSKFTSDLLVKVLSSVSFFTMFMIKFIAFHLNIDAIKDLLAQLQYTCSELKDDCESAIIRKYSQNARRYTVALTILGVSSVFILIIVQFWANILNVILPRNISRPRHIPIMTEYFIDQEKYFYLIVLHIHVSICIGAIVIVSTGTMMIAYLEYICGLFRISSYRIERAMGTNVLQNITVKNKTLIFEGIIYAVDIHRQAMRLSELILSKFEVMLFGLITFGVISLSLNLFRIFQIASTERDIKEILMPLVFAISIIVYMFIANYVGQNVTNHNNCIYVTAYNVQWYIAPLNIQRLILFLLQRSAKDFSLNVGGIFYASIECFATLLKTSVSYFTVIYSTLNRTLLLAFGLWPYQQSKLTRLQFILFFGILTSSILFQVFQMDSSIDNIRELIFPVLFIFISIFYMFIANYIGQDVMDHTNQVFVTVYNVQWYVVPLHIQRIILFLLQRGTKDFTLRVGGLFIGSLECFATLVKASVSYFTVMRSMR